MNNRRFRLALISTPRSGNTWLRLLLGDIYALEHFAVHKPDDLDWDALPERCILQLHWSRSEDFLTRLRLHDFKTVTIARNPLDVLLSILHFSARAPQTAYWLAGRGGNEDLVINQCPTSHQFADYAMSERAGYLLSISRDWWGNSDAKIKYEDLVISSEESLMQLANNLGQPVSSIPDAVEKYAFANLKPTSSNEHYWQGSPGLWKHCIPEDLVLEIYRCHEQLFTLLGYDIAHANSDVALCAKNWKELN